MDAPWRGSGHGAAKCARSTLRRPRKLRCGRSNACAQSPARGSKETDTFGPRGPTRTDRDRLGKSPSRSEEHTSELQSQSNLVCRLLLEKKKITITAHSTDVAGLSVGDYRRDSD